MANLNNLTKNRTGNDGKIAKVKYIALTTEQYIQYCLLAGIEDIYRDNMPILHQKLASTFVEPMPQYVVDYCGKVANKFTTVYEQNRPIEYCNNEAQLEDMEEAIIEDAERSKTK